MDIENLRKKWGTLNDDDQSWREIQRKHNRRRTKGTTGTREEEDEKRETKVRKTLQRKQEWKKIEDGRKGEVNNVCQAKKAVRTK